MEQMHLSMAINGSSKKDPTSMGFKPKNISCIPYDQSFILKINSIKSEFFRAFNLMSGAFDAF